MASQPKVSAGGAVAVPDDADGRVVIFRAGGERFAVDAECVDAVVDGFDARALPGFSEYVVGLLRHRGEWTLALDVGPALGVAAAERSEAAVVVRHEGMRYALVAEAMPSTTWIDADAVRLRGGPGTPDGGSSGAHELPVFLDADGPVTRIDPAELFGVTVPDDWEETMNPSSVSVSPRPVVAFRVGDQHFALDVFEVHEVLNYESPRSMPRAPEFVEGVLDVRDGVIPVVDMRARFELEATAPDDETRILVVSLGDERIGLVVDAVSDVVHLAPESVDPPPDYFRGLAEEYLAGIARMEDRVLIVLRVDRVLTAEQRLALIGDGEEAASES